jgi:preprotein translocase subunit SecA
MLQQLDIHWREHLASLDALRQGIHLRGYAQKNPKQEYKREAFSMFTDMLESFKKNIITILSKVQFRKNDPNIDSPSLSEKPQELSMIKSDAPNFQPLQNNYRPVSKQKRTHKKPETFIREANKVGRNEPCPCGSKKKYKQCHGKI